MKAIQFTIDERLLRRLDSHAEAARRGRSAVIRDAIAEYLRSRRKDLVREQYEQAYGSGGWIDDDFPGWTEEGEWPGS